MSVKKNEKISYAETPIKVGFLGYGTRALDALMEMDRFKVECFITPKARMCQDVVCAHEKYPDIPYMVVEDNRELAEVLRNIKGLDCIVMNACNIILSREILGIYDVYNIHPGDMQTNRGHQPHMWSILLREKTSTIVIHKVTPEIDEGDIISEISVDITDDMTDLDLLNRLEDEIPYLLDGLYSHIRMGVPPVDSAYGGEYRQIMTYSDYEVELANIDRDEFEEDMLRKIRARGSKHGAFVSWDGQRVYFDKLIAKIDTNIDLENRDIKIVEREDSEIKILEKEDSAIKILEKEDGDIKTLEREDEEIENIENIETGKVILTGKHVRYICRLNKIEPDVR